LAAFQHYIADNRSSQQRIWVWLLSGAWWKWWFCHSLCCTWRNCWESMYEVSVANILLQDMP